MTTRRPTAQNDKALDAFIAAKSEIDVMLARLQAFSADHFGAQPDAIDWGDVGTLKHYASLLRRIADSAFHEGEHSEWSCQRKMT